MYITSKQGFTLIEIMVTLGIVSMALFLVGALTKQVLNLAKSGKQTAALLELRNATSAISRNPESWIGKMKGSSGIYSSCLDKDLLSFNCPAPNNALLNSDAELQRLVGTMHVVDSNIVNAMGEKIAGTVNEPHYMNTDGRPCVDQAQCALKSTGYFIRQNSAVSSEPGYVKFVVKVEKNPNLTGELAVGLPMKPQYMSVDIGESWKTTSVSQNCPTGTIKVGYLSGGSPQCINPTASCPSGQIQLGIDENAQPMCQTPPSTCSSGQVAILNPSTGSLMCSASSECTQGVFAGYYAGTGQVMCLSSSGCASGVQIGQQPNGQALCANIPTCNATMPHLAFSGTSFSCQANPTSIVASTCADGTYVKGIGPDGGVVCAPVRDLAGADGRDGQDGNNGSNGTNGGGSVVVTSECREVHAQISNNRGAYCGANEVSVGWRVPGAQDDIRGDDFIVKCCKLSGGAAADPRSLGLCPVGQYLRGFDENGARVCENFDKAPELTSKKWRFPEVDYQDEESVKTLPLSGAKWRTCVATRYIHKTRGNASVYCAVRGTPGQDDWVGELTTGSNDYGWCEFSCTN